LRLIVRYTPVRMVIFQRTVCLSPLRASIAPLTLEICEISLRITLSLTSLSLKSVTEKINGLAPDLSCESYFPYIADLPKFGVKETLALKEVIKEMFGKDFYKGKCVQIYTDLFIEDELDSGFNVTLPMLTEEYRIFSNDHQSLFSVMQEQMKEKLKFIDSILLEAQTALVDAAVNMKLPEDFNELNLSEFIEESK